jgi:hypothetical protein
MNFLWNSKSIKPANALFSTGNRVYSLVIFVSTWIDVYRLYSLVWSWHWRISRAPGLTLIDPIYSSARPRHWRIYGGRADVVQPTYIHQLTDEYRWVRKLPSFLFVFFGSNTSSFEFANTSFLAVVPTHPSPPSEVATSLGRRPRSPSSHPAAPLQSLESPGAPTTPTRREPQCCPAWPPPRSTRELHGPPPPRLTSTTHHRSWRKEPWRPTHPRLGPEGTAAGPHRPGRPPLHPEATVVADLNAATNSGDVSILLNFVFWIWNLNVRMNCFDLNTRRIWMLVNYY